MDSIYLDIAGSYAAAAESAPGLKARFQVAGFDPSTVRSLDDLSRLPVLKKEELLALQRENPPFGGFSSSSSATGLKRIYVSPGPIFEPSLAGNGHGLDLLFRHAGIGLGDLVLNAWSYHLVPAGLLFDEAAQEVGATVIPGGVGNSDLQAQIIVETGVTAVCASTAFFLTLADTVVAKYGRTAWKVKTAFLGGEMGDWMAKRRRIEAEYGVRTWAAYATADLGLVACEDGGEGYAVHPDRVVQICDPLSGVPLRKGEVGEIVVTTRDAGWPMIRFGSGDSASAIEVAPDGRVLRLSALQGRVGAAVKVREIFVYPRAIEDMAISVEGLVAAQAVVSRRNDRDHVRLRLMAEPAADIEIVRSEAMISFANLTRIRADAVEFVSSIDPDAAPLVNERDG